MDQVRRIIHGEILARRRTTDFSDPPVQPRSLTVDDDDSFLQRASKRAAIGLNVAAGCALRLGAVLPWSAKHFWLSLSYQVAVLVLNVVILLQSLVRASAALSGNVEVYGTTLPFIISDIVIALGSVVGLIAVGHSVCRREHWGSGEAGKQYLGYRGMHSRDAA